MEIDMEVELKTINATLLKEGETYVVDYGTIKYKQNGKVDVEISNIGMKDISARAGCTSCTTVSLKKNQNSVTLTITYDTKNVGKFDKSVSFFHQGQLTKFKIRGVVTH